MENMMSLYDYLGHAAGGNLGKEVFKVAKTKGVKTGIREVSNPKYTGKITLYPKAFLDEYFTPPVAMNENKLPF
jgi:hypothetical protein